MNANSGTRPSASTGLGEFLSQASFWLPDRLVELAWLEHAPFAFWLMEALKPKIFVETGTSNDFSYLALCQSVRRLGFASKGYAIGWQGDEHGIHQDKDYERLRADHDPLFGEFSRLSRSTSSEALQQFSSGSIDLLHIDRRHTYEDVKYDFEFMERQALRFCRRSVSWHQVPRGWIWLCQVLGRVARAIPPF